MRRESLALGWVVASLAGASLVADTSCVYESRAEGERTTPDAAMARARTRPEAAAADAESEFVARTSGEDAGVEPTVLDGLGCGPNGDGAAENCSGTSATGAILVIKNGCAERLDVWSATQPTTCPTCCAEAFSLSVDPGQTLALSAFVTQVWRLRLPDGGDTVFEIPPLAPGATTVSLSMK